jgi:hypothetical protein
MVIAVMPERMSGQLAFGGAVRSRKPRSRHDSLPEFTRYRDDGCDIHPTCLSCPLPRCRYEEPGGLRALLNESRDREIMELRTRGVSVEQLAVRFDVSRRTVFRVLGAKGAPRRRRIIEDFEPIPIRPIRSTGPVRQVSETRREAHCA